MMKVNILLILFLIFSWKLLHAQQERQLTPAEIKQLTVINEPLTLFKGYTRTGFSYLIIYGNNFFDLDGNKTAISNAFGKQWTLQNITIYGITDKLQVGFGLPYTSKELTLSNNFEVPLSDIYMHSKWEQSGSGLSDISLFADYQLLTQSENSGLVGQFTLTLPTGRKNPSEIIDENNFRAPTGNGAMVVDLAMKYRKTKYPMMYEGRVGYALYMKGKKQFEPNGNELSFRDGNHLYMSASHGYHLNDWLAVINDINYNIFGVDTVDGVKASTMSTFDISWMPRLSFQIKRVRFNQGLTVPLKGRLSGADVSYILIVQYMI